MTQNKRQYTKVICFLYTDASISLFYFFMQTESSAVSMFPTYTYRISSCASSSVLQIPAAVIAYRDAP